MLDNYIKFFKIHEKLALFIIFLAVTGFLGNKYLDRTSSETVARNQAAQATLAAQKEANDKLAVQNQQASAQYSALLGQLNQQNSRLTAEMLQLSQSLAARQKQDAALTLPELALRHESLLGVSSGVASTENGFLVSSPVELQTVQSLETLPVLQANLKDEQTLVTNKDQQISGLNGIVTGLSGQVDGLRLQLTDSSKACDARVAVAKKSKWRWFKFGVVTGFIGGIAAGHYIP